VTVNGRKTDPLVVLAVTVLLVIAWFIRHGLLLIYVSIVFAVLFTPAVEWIQRRRIGKWHPSHGIALLLLIATATIAVGTFAFFAIPPIVSDAQSLATDIPNNIQQLRTEIRGLPFGDRLAEHVTGDSLAKAGASFSAAVLKVFHGVTGALSSLVTIFLLTIYFILDGARSFRWALALLPSSRRDRAEKTALHARDVMQKWLGGQLILMAILGSSTTVVLGLLGVRYFYVLGVFAALANFVPVLGPIATVVVAGLIAALDSWLKVLGVIIFYFVYQQVENAYLTPKIVGSTVGLPGVAVLVALVIGSELAGIVGAVVAVPTAAILSTFIDEYAHDHAASPDYRNAA
jgi:predicted PurR-regulated permease PerM